MTLPDPDVLHLVLGPDRHGVVRHARQIAEACGHRMLRAVDAAALPALPDADVVHVAFTDRLFGADIDQAVTTFERIAGVIADIGAALSVTLHDVPHDDTALQRRRRSGYRRVAAAARGVVVNSRVELALVERWHLDAWSLRLAPLPVLEAATPGQTRMSGGVGVLGFVYPDRGYDDVLAAVALLSSGPTVTAIGGVADGHEDLMHCYAADPRWRSTGYVPEAVLAAHAARTSVPVAPNRRSTASGSVNSWLAYGRRPLVPDSPLGRELAADRPGAITLYDPDDPQALADAIEAALADPSGTMLAPHISRGPSLADAAGTYASHFATCMPDAAVTTPAGTLVPDNRWDLVPHIAEPPAVSVVVPYYDAQSSLDRVLTALDKQTLRPAEVIVVDDGSPAPPIVSPQVTLLRQHDLGFRAARARNLGAAAATGDVLVFLDGDTIPEPNLLAELSRLPAACPDAVAVGRRRHRGTNGAELPEPAWLRDAYRDSADLLHADRRSYRYVISAALAVPRDLFAGVGGFDERFVGYGGEDWELAHRLRTAGAVVAHVPSAVAWHDGPDWAGRGDSHSRSVAKNGETAALAVLLPDADARGAGRWWPYPSVIVHAGVMSDVDALATVRSAGDADCAVWFDDITGPRADLVRDSLLVGEPATDALERAWCRVWLHGPCDLSDVMTISDEAERHGRVDSPVLTARSSRSVARMRRWACESDHLFGRRDRSAPGLRPADDLAGRLRGQR